MPSSLNSWSSRIDLIRRVFFPKRPTHVDIELSNRCNLKCSMCWFHGLRGVGDRYRKTEMTTAQVFAILNQIAPFRPYLYFGGGEPFIRDDFIEILSCATQLKLPVAFTTNGVLLDPERAARVVDLGVDAINFSIDGLEKSHDRMRGQGCYKKTLSSLRELVSCKRRAGQVTPGIFVNITLNRSIIGQLKETIHKLREETGDGVDFYRVHHLWFLTAEELKAHQVATHKALHASAPGADAHQIAYFRDHETRLLAKELSELKEIKKVVFFPDLTENEICSFYSEDYTPSKRCMAPFHAILVKPNGDVKFCPDEWIDDYVLGNVRDTRFLEIWNSNKARRFRWAILCKRSFPACKRCSWMHCY